MAKNTEVAMPDDQFPVLFGGANMSRVMEENFGPDGVRPEDLDRINLPAGGATSWEIPSLSGMDTEKALDGIILHWTRPRTFWKTSIEDGGGGSPPDCFSNDGDVGIGAYGPGSELNISGACQTCPMDQWGSDPSGGRGKGCREGRLLYMLRPNDVIPVAVGLPVSSIQPLRKYFLRLASASKSFYEVVTRLELERKEDGGMRWSVVVPSVAAELNAEQTEAARNFAATFKKEDSESASE